MQQEFEIVSSELSDSSESTSRPPVAAIVNKIPRSKRSCFLSSLKDRLLVWSELVLLLMLFDWTPPNLSFSKFALFLPFSVPSYSKA